SPAVEDLDPPGPPRGQFLGQLSCPVRRLVVDHEEPRVRVLHDTFGDAGEVEPFIVGRKNDEQGHARGGWRKVARPAPARITRAGSMMGIRNRSCGKNTRATSTDDPTRSQSPCSRPRSRRHRTMPRPPRASTVRYESTDAAR